MSQEGPLQGSVMEMSESGVLHLHGSSTGPPGAKTVEEFVLVAPFPAGSVTDSVSRSLAQALSPALAGQSLGVERTKADLIDESKDFSQILTGLFLILGGAPQRLLRQLASWLKRLGAGSLSGCE